MPSTTLATAIGTIAAQQATATEAMPTNMTEPLNYCETHPDATIKFWVRNMCLQVKSDASCRSKRCRASGYHYLSDAPDNPTRPNTKPPMRNSRPIDIVCQILREVVSSAAKAETGALFHNGKTAAHHRIVLEELGHKQPTTPIVTDNSTATSIANHTVKQKSSQGHGYVFLFLGDRVLQGQLIVYWKPGATNKADFFQIIIPQNTTALRDTSI